MNQDNWNATSFTTGANAGGYTLTGATFSFAAASNSPSNFEARIYDDNSGEPGNSLGALTGDLPLTAGNHAFSTTGISLSANTTYFVVATSTDTGINRFRQNLTASGTETSSDGWTIGNQAHVLTEDQGASWQNEGGQSLMFSISATPVPEPHEYAMFVGLGLMGFVAARRHLVSKALS